MDKKAVRKSLLQERMQMHERDRSACNAALHHELRNWLLARADAVIGAWWPIRAEFNPLPALQCWKEEGESNKVPLRRCIGLPVTQRDTKTMHYALWHPGCDMGPDPSGIPVPKGTETLTPSLILAPCVGYGHGGYRLGFGGGYFDRTLAQLRPRPFTVGVCYAQGYIEGFQPEPHDIALDVILTENGVVWPPKHSHD